MPVASKFSPLMALALVPLRTPALHVGVGVGAVPACPRDVPLED